MAHEQSEQRSDQKASAQEAAMVMMVMMAMAVMTAKDHVSQAQDTKQTQHFSFLRIIVSQVPVIRYGYRIKLFMSEKQDQR